MLLPVVVLVLVLVLLYLPPVQQFLGTRAAGYVSGRTGTRVELKKLRIGFPLRVGLDGLFVADQRGDTLLHAERIRANAGLRSLLGGRLLLRDVQLSGVRANLRQDADSTFNFDFIIAAFATEEPKAAPPSDTTGGFAIDVRSVHLEHILFTMDLEPSELGLRVDLGTLDVSLDEMALDPLRFHVDAIKLRNTTVDLSTRSGEPEPPSYPELTNPLADIDVRFRMIRLDNVRSSISTVNTGDSLWIAVDHSTINAREIDASVQRWHLANVDLDGFRLGTLSKSGSVEAGTIENEPLWLDQHDGFRYWTQDWDLALDRLSVNNSSLAFHTDSISSSTLLLDPAHVAFTDVGMDARAIIVRNDEVHMTLDRIRIQGGPKNGTIEAGFVLAATPSSFLLEQGRLRAEGNSVGFVVKAWPEELAHVYRDPQLIPMEVEADADLRMADLLPLLDQLEIRLPATAATEERWRTKLWLNGSVQRIEEMGIALDGDQGSVIHANASATNILHWPESDYSITVDQLILGKGLHKVMRAFAPEDAPLPVRLAFRGDARGHGYDLSGQVDLQSDLGDLEGRAEVGDWQGYLPNHLDLDLTAEHIAIARFTGDTATGPLSFSLTAKADGLHSELPNGSLTFTPTQFTYNNNDLSSLRLQANVGNDSLYIDLSSNAASAELHLVTTGPFPAPEDSLKFDFDLNVVRLHLQELALTSHAVNMEGPITGHVALTRDARGHLSLHAPGLRFFNADRTFSFDRMTLNGLLDNDSTALELDCDIARVSYHANLAMDSTLALLRARLLGAFQEPYAFTPPPGRTILLKVDLPGNERLTSLLMPELKAMEVERFEGSYHSDGDSLRFDVDIPWADIGGIQVSGLRLDLSAAGPRLDGELAVGRVMRDSLHLDDLLLQAKNSSGKLSTLLRLRDGTTDRYRIGVDLGREDGVPVIHVQDDLILDRRVWIASEENALYLDPSGIRAKDMLLNSGDQRIELRTTDDGNQLEVTGFDLSNISGLIRDVDSLAMAHGTLDAMLVLPKQGRAGSSMDIQFHDLEVLDVEFGTVEAHLEEEDPGHFKGDLNFANAKDQGRFDLAADLSAEAPSIVADGSVDLQDLAQFKPFVESYLFELGGALKGDLRYEQHGNEVVVLGMATLKDARVGLVRTGAVYRLKEDTVTFDRKGIALRDLVVLDAKDNRFQLDGRVNTGVGMEPGLDLRLRTERFQLVNSTVEQNPMFFGKLYNGIDLHIGGTAAAPIVKGKVSVLDSTAISVVLPGSRVEMVDHAGIVQFTDQYHKQDTLMVRSDSEMLRDSLAAQLPGMELDLEIDLDRNATFSIVIDPTTGDAAKFRGEADLKFRYDAEGDISLQGPLTVVEGGYTLEFYGLVKKRFDLVPGGTIIWDGDPLTGRMDVEAKYSTKVAPYPLVANARGGLSESERNSLQAPLPFDVIIHIQDAVQAPRISFGLEMDRMVRNSYPQVNSVLDQLAKPANEEELNRQVFGLLVLSTFIENDNGSSAGGSDLATTAARNSVNSILTQQLNKLTGQGIKGMDIQLGVNTYDQTQGGESYSRTSVDYKVTQHILNDRVSIEAGGSMGYNENKQDVSAMSNTKAPQYAIAYDITEDGRLRARLYHENAYDLYDGELVNNGAAIMLTRDFEKDNKERMLRREAIKEEKRRSRNGSNAP